MWQKSSFSGGQDGPDSRIQSATPTELAAFVRHIRAEVTTCA
ncbi:hypothetical protein T261_4921 [Streptomyces lydicus]|nr:hypothetical protein T261_4921 [Streptomyces lydicus]